MVQTPPPFLLVTSVVSHRGFSSYLIREACEGLRAEVSGDNGITIVMIRRTPVMQAAGLLMIGLMLNLPSNGFAQATTNVRALETISRQAEARFDAQRGPTWARLAAETSGPYGKLNENPEIELMGIGADGRAIYYGTDNINAARTTRVDQLWPGGRTGFDLTGLNTFSMAVWDGGPVRDTHVEFGGRVVVQNGGTPANHATHVAGTMAAAGVNPNAKGASYEGYLFSYDWDNDESEMAAAAPNLNISNHSYSRISGWRSSNGDWYWYGNPNISEEEDYGFGFYDGSAANWDAIAYNAPNYLICKSAGNDRNDNGPGVSGTYYIDYGSGWTEVTGDAPPRDGGADGFDCIAWYSTAKNIMTVGAVDDLPVSGYTGPGSVDMSSFSCWGPVDDGRIKPDIVANGVSLTSSYGTADDAYSSSSGTSMATPNFAGTANLLFQHYLNTHQEVARASMIKALVQHTADEAGPNDGPDYMYGWGLVNAEAAAEMISADAIQLYPLQDIALADDDTTRLLMHTDGTEPIRVTIAWTDPPGTPVASSLDPTDPMLVNDLDLRLIQVGGESPYMPWVLNLENPTEAAIHGDNDVDVSEQVYIAEPSEGDYIIQVSHKGELVNDEQVYSIAISGLTWSEDPRVPPTDLHAGVTMEDGSVHLIWQQEGMESEDFINFSIFRDGELIGTTAETEYNTAVPEFGLYEFTVQSNWTLGSSSPNPTATALWPAPVTPVNLQVTIVDTTEGSIVLSWDAVREVEQVADDGSAEEAIFFSASTNPGLMVVRPFAMPITQDRVTSFSGYLQEGDDGYGAMEFILFDEAEEGGPGVELYRSDAFTPSEDGWFELWVNNGVGVQVETQSTYYAGIVWQEPGTTEVGLDESSPVVPGSYFSPNGTNWTLLSDFVSGVFNGNALLRVRFGSLEEVNVNGLSDFAVSLNDDLQGTTTEMSYSLTVNSAELNSLSVTAQYEQGNSTAAEIELPPFANSVGDSPEQPWTWEIGQAYPNPFNPSVGVPVTLANRSHVQMTVYDILGRQVASQQRTLRAGQHTLNWTADGVASGVYFLRVQAGPETALQKVVLMR